MRGFDLAVVLIIFAILTAVFLYDWWERSKDSERN